MLSWTSFWLGPIPRRPLTQMAFWTVCHEHISRTKEVWRCTRDEGRPLEVGSQVPASNPCKLRSSRAIVVSVAAKGGRQSRQVRSGEASESELLMTCRNAKDDVKTGGASSFRDQVRSEEHTSELQSQSNLVCRLLLEKKN